MSEVSSQQLSDLYESHLCLIENSGSLLFPVDRKPAEIVRKALRSNLNPTPTSVLAAVNLPVPNSNIGMKPIMPLSADPLDTTCFQFGQGQTEWYFFSGHMESMGFTVMLFKIELAGGALARAHQIFNPADACLYSVAAGYGKRDGPWITCPATAFTAEYGCGNDNSPSGPGWTFQANVPTADCPFLQQCNVLFTNPVGDAPATVALNLQWTDPSEAAGLRVINTVFTMDRGPAVNEGPSGCVPGCGSGVGSLYWSYPLTSVSGTLGTTSNLSGTGWIDHQWFQTGILRNPFLRTLGNIYSPFAAAPVVLRWFWLTAQTKSKQYMIPIIISAPPIPPRDSPISPTGVISCSLQYGMGSKAVKIVSGTATYGIDGTATILEMVQRGSTYFPTRYKLEIDGNQYILQAAFGQSLVYLPRATLNWEGAADLFAADGTTRLGTGFIESNQLETETELLTPPLRSAGVPMGKMCHFKVGRPPATICAFSILFFLIPIVIILSLIALCVNAYYTSK